MGRLSGVDRPRSRERRGVSLDVATEAGQPSPEVIGGIAARLSLELADLPEQLSRLARVRRSPEGLSSPRCQDADGPSERHSVSQRDDFSQHEPTPGSSTGSGPRIVEGPPVDMKIVYIVHPVKSSDATATGCWCRGHDRVLTPVAQRGKSFGPLPTPVAAGILNLDRRRSGGARFLTVLALRHHRNPLRRRIIPR